MQQQKKAPPEREITGWGAWIRTKIHSSKGWCAALAPRPRTDELYHSDSGMDSSVLVLEEAGRFQDGLSVVAEALPGSKPSLRASSNVMTSGLVGNIAGFLGGIVPECIDILDLGLFAGVANNASRSISGSGS